MQYSAGQKGSTPRNTAVTLMVVLAASMIGASTGVLIADRDALLYLKGDIAEQFAGVLGSLPARADTASTKPEIPPLQDLRAMRPDAKGASKVIRTGLPAIGVIHYSRRSGSANVTFDLEPALLVRTGELGTPDRIYFDLRNSRREKRESGRLKAQKSIRIDDDLVTRVRLAQGESGIMRIVFDLKHSCDFTCQISPGPSSRLHVELRPRPASTSVSK